MDIIGYFHTHAFVISQIIMIGAIVLDYLSFRQKTKIAILYFLVPSSVLIWIHYFLLWLTTTSLLYIIAVTRLIISRFIQDDSNRSTMTLTFLIIQSTIFMTFFDNDKLSILAYVAHCLFIIWTFQRSDKELRIAFMFGTIILIIYNWIVFSPVAFVAESVYLYSNIIHFKKYHLT